jgi:hypothetical protein
MHQTTKLQMRMTEMKETKGLNRISPKTGSRHLIQTLWSCGQIFKRMSMDSLAKDLKILYLEMKLHAQAVQFNKGLTVYLRLGSG